MLLYYYHHSLIKLIKSPTINSNSGLFKFEQFHFYSILLQNNLFRGQSRQQLSSQKPAKAKKPKSQKQQN